MLALLLSSPLRPTVPTTPLRVAQPLVCKEPAAEQPVPAYADTAFDRALRGIISDADSMGIQPAVDSWLEKIDDLFIPTLASRIDAASASELPPELPGGGADELPKLVAVLEALQLRSQDRFERAREQLQTLLTAGEINDMNAQLIRLIKKNEIDAGFLYVLLRNMEAAEKAGEESMVRLLGHLHTVTQEELEKRTDPALGLLHKLTRLDDAGIRGRVLREYLVGKKTLALPDGSEMPLKEPAKAQIAPLDFAGAVEQTLDKVLALPVEREQIASTVETVRLVAKEARAVVEESYTVAELDEFTEALTPVFARALP
jgi:hypothetical protein